MTGVNYYPEGRDALARTADVEQFIEGISRPLMVYRFARAMLGDPRQGHRRGAAKRLTKAAEELREAASNLVLEAHPPDVEVHNRVSEEWRSTERYSDGGTITGRLTSPTPFQDVNPLRPRDAWESGRMSPESRVAELGFPADWKQPEPRLETDQEDER